MIQRRRRVTARVHLPLRRLALCLDCEECFEIGEEACPACGSETWTPLARFLDDEPSDALPRHVGAAYARPTLPRRRPDEPPNPRHLIIVAATRVKLYDHLRRAFNGNESVLVMLDRRTNERRRTSAPAAVERRLADRRVQSATTEQLKAIGWAVVSLSSGRSPRRSGR